MGPPGLTATSASGSSWSAAIRTAMVSHVSQIAATADVAISREWAEQVVDDYLASEPRSPRFGDFLEHRLPKASRERLYGELHTMNHLVSHWLTCASERCPRCTADGLR